MLADLPAELKALASFLETDERPTAIFREGSGDPRTWDAVYSNQAFLARGAAAIQQATTFTQHSCDHPQTGQNEPEWSVRDVGNGFLAVTQRVLQERNLINASTQRDDDVPTTSHHERAQNLDWIKFPRSDLTKWQQFFLQHNWKDTPLGPLEDWNFELRSAVLSATADPAPRTMYWGPQNVFLYNESFVPIFGIKHPDCLGQPLELAWRPGMREIIWPYILNAYQGGTQKIERLAMSLERNGFLEETYWDATLTPTMGQDGSAIGVQNVLNECTRAVQSERRRLATTSLAKHIASADSLADVWSSFLSGLSCLVVDLPYAIFYAAENDVSEVVSNATDNDVFAPERTSCTLHGTMGVQQPEHLPNRFTLDQEIAPDSTTALRSAFATAWKKQEPVMLSLDDGSLPSYLSLSNADRGYGDLVKQAMVFPVTSLTNRDLMGVLVVGICPRVPFDDGYEMWLRILADVLLKAAAFISLPIEQRKAQQMSDDINNALAKQLQLTTLQAERSDQKFSRMANHSPLGMYVLDPDGIPLYVNDAYKRLVPALPDGHPVSFNKPSDWTDFIHPDDVCQFWASWEKVIVQKIPDICEYRIMKERQSVNKAAGEQSLDETWLLATSFPEVEPDGRVSVIMGWITDISKQKAAERLLSQRLEDALETKRQSENFIDMTSHEMRNPLSSILLSADSIVSSLQSSSLTLPGNEHNLTSPVVKDIVDAAQTILLCASHQKKIVDDILTLSKLDASLLEIAPDKVQIPELVERALRMFDTEIIHAGIRTRLVIEPTYDDLEVDWVVLDPSRLLQVIINLLTNAIKFTQDANVREITVYIGASYERPTGKHHGVNFVPLRHTKHPSMSTSGWGDGEDVYLQVAIADTGAGLDDDKIQLLFKRFAQASPKTYKQYGGSGLGLFISRELCELQGGQIGVSSCADKTTFTFYVKAKRWVEDDTDEPAELTRFVSTSSSRMGRSRRGSSMTIHTSDRPQNLRNGLHLDGVADSVSVLPTQIALGVVADHTKHLHVLVVEDNLINQKVMAQQLRKAGLTVHVANHGLECLDFLSQSSYSSEPTTPALECAPTPLSIILLDLEMPVMDGLTCIRHIREKQLSGEIVGHIPVIAVTANARSDQINSAIVAGMDEVVTKPFRIPDLLSQMQKLVSEVLGRM